MLERQLSEIWTSQRFGGSLMTSGGTEVTVIYPGRINDSRGGDFCDVVLSLGGRKVRGDVELHVRANDWRAHGHDRDPSYNRVVLHVVYSHAGGAPTILESGREVPVLALGEQLWWRSWGEGGGRSGGDGRWPCLSALRRLGEAAVAAVVERAGEERFGEKTARFRLSLEEGNGGEVLYQSVMAALGYSKNKDTFLELARRVPLAELESVTRGDESDRECGARVEELLLKVAGLAPAGRARGGMAAADWEMFRTRPSNSPQSRIAAMSCLLVRYRREGLLSGMLGAFKIAAATHDYRCLESAVVAGRSAAGGVAPGGTGCDVLGRDRAADIIVNALLPFFNALGDRWREPGLSDSAISMYCSWPRLGGNCVERHMMVQVGLPRVMVNSARRQQGFIEIYAKHCSRGRCAVCGLGQAEAGDDVQVKASALPGDEPEIPGRGDHGGIVGA